LGQTDLLFQLIQGGNKMNIIKIKNEFMHSPLWYCDENGIEWDNEKEFIDFISDSELQSIAKKIEELFNSYYEFESHNQPCWFNEEKEKKDKQQLLALLNQLKDKLNELNDGLVDIEDLETPRVEKL
jgi:hypothetical protein